LRHILIFIVTFIIIDSSYANPRAKDTLFFVNGIPVYNNAIVDLDRKGKVDEIKLILIEDDYDFSNFVLIINDDSVQGKHSYNVSGFIIIDLDTADDLREVGIYTQNANGPDEYIIYKYDNWISEIGRINSYATFPGDGKIIVDTEMMFWIKTDTVLYDADFEILKFYPKEFYEINIETEVLKHFSLFSDRDNFITIAKLESKDIVTIIKCDTSPFCEDEILNSYETCDWYQIRAGTGQKGWAQLKTIYQKLDLLWRP
jgi:hypothetical protein